MIFSSVCSSIEMVQYARIDTQNIPTMRFVPSANCVLSSGLSRLLDREGMVGCARDEYVGLII